MSFSVSISKESHRKHFKLFLNTTLVYKHTQVKKSSHIIPKQRYTHIYTHNTCSQTQLNNTIILTHNHIHTQKYTTMSITVPVRSTHKYTLQHYTRYNRNY